MKSVVHIPWCALALLCANGLHAQEPPSGPGAPDTQIWLSAGARTNPFQKTDGSKQGRFARELTTIGEVEMRRNEHLSRMKQLNLDAEARYPINSIIQVGARYRYSIRDIRTNNRHRLNMRLMLKWKCGRFTAGYRGQYEHTFVPEKKFRTLLRNRLELRYDLPGWKLDPKFNAESFTALHYTGNKTVGMRYTLSTAFNLDKQKKKELEVGLRYDQKLHRKDPTNSWILVLAYGHEFKKK